jgi:hydroxypyruvate reductase
MTSESSPNLTARLASVLRRALGKIDLAARVRDALPEFPREADSVALIAIGKAAPAMAAGVLARWSAYVEETLIIAPDGTPCALDGPRVEIMRAGHPLPDARSVAAGQRALAIAAMPRRKLLLVMVSGGASSLAMVPSRDVSLDDLREVSRTLLAAGAPIAEVNTVRRHLSKLHGGGLTRIAAPGRTLALLASDVIHGGVHDIGSGPTTPDPTTAEDARAVLLRHARKFRALPLRETLKFGDPAAPLQRSRTIVGPNDLALAVQQELTLQGYSARILPPSIEEVGSLAAEYATEAAQLPEGHALVRVAEPQLPLPAPPATFGRGGRAGHLAAAVARFLPEGVAFLAAASDGTDGTSGAGGAVVDARFVTRIGAARIDRALARFDSASLHEEAATVLAGPSTGLNLADVHVLVRERPRDSSA